MRSKSESRRRAMEIRELRRAKFACLEAAIRAPFADDSCDFPDFEEVARLMIRHRKLRT